MADKTDYISVFGKNIFYKTLNTKYRDGKKPFLVFLHEGLGCSEQWKDFPAILSEAVECPVLLYDRFRYGKSDFIDRPFDKNYMHDEAFVVLPELLSKLDIEEKLILIGHSDGGTISLLFASKFPEKTKALITEADHVICEEQTTNGVAGVVDIYKKGNLKNFLKKYQKENTDKLFYGWSGFWISEEAKDWDIISYLENIKAPLLAIQGKDDQYGSKEQLIVKIKNVGGDVNIAFLQNCGHIPHHEQKEIVFQKMKSFIEPLIN
ncbi:MAG: alpha/beta fold hydrolase [Bacteroidota bacterium]